MKQDNRQKTELLNAVNFYRGMILDVLEVEIGHLSQWHHLRRKILHVLGDRGLSAKIVEILNGGSQ